MKKTLVAVAVAISSLAFQGHTARREPAGLAFPRVQATSDVDGILEDYPAYLRFVLAVGKNVDRHTADRLERTYDKLRHRDPNGAALFLRGLRFEMLQKLELMGVSEQSVSTSNPVIRKWIARYQPQWYREADEYLFRAVTDSIAKR